MNDQTPDLDPGDADLPTGYRWAEPGEESRPDAIFVPRTVRPDGTHCTHEELRDEEYFGIAVLDGVEPTLVFNRPAEPVEYKPERPPLTRPSTAFERPPGNVYVIPEGHDIDSTLDPDGPARFFANLTGESGDHAPIDAVVRLAREAGMETMRVDENGDPS